MKERKVLQYQFASAPFLSPIPTCVSHVPTLFPAVLLFNLRTCILAYIHHNKRFHSTATAFTEPTVSSPELGGDGWVQLLRHSRRGGAWKRSDGKVLEMAAGSVCVPDAFELEVVHWCEFGDWELS